MTVSHADFTHSNAVARLDGWLRFHPKVAARYERETGAARLADIRSSVYVGLCFYNLLDLAAFALTPDIVVTALVSRLLLFTPLALFLAWVVGYVDARWRETLTLVGMIVSVSVPLMLFSLTRAPLGPFMFIDVALIMVFGNMVMSLRFRLASAFTATTFALSTFAAALNGDLPVGLRFAFVVQLTAACGLTIIANYRAELRRCADYLTALEARLHSEAAEGEAEQMRDLVDADALTGLPNRRYLDRILAEWFAGRAPIAVMMIDIDHFKLFNDALGHPAGDDCLRASAAAFARLVEDGDAIAARFGGEEFVIAARGIDPWGAARLAARVVRSVEQLAVAHPGRQDGVRIVTASVGVALRPADGTADAEIALKRADEALYEAKRRGRNCYVFADPKSAGLLARA